MIIFLMEVLVNSKNKRPVNCYKDCVDEFEHYYPHLKELFLSRCLKLAVVSKDFFEQVFFNELFTEIK